MVQPPPGTLAPPAPPLEVPPFVAPPIEAAALPPVAPPVAKLPPEPALAVAPACAPPPGVVDAPAPAVGAALIPPAADEPTFLLSLLELPHAALPMLSMTMSASCLDVTVLMRISTAPRRRD